jgi:asparagine synthase (glutamine-hydrolysing)
MCGICGKINIDGEPVNENLIKSMVSTLTHRGPDDEGFYFKNGVGLGHRRLSIIDLSSHARQPITNEDGKIWIVYNGEIYNFPDLREDLIRKGHTFRSKSDTETIIHLYEEHGVESLTCLRGMFAFAIWDERDKTLLLARDRVGKKPLYYYFDGRSFIFGSEIKAIIADKGIERIPDYTAIHHYLTYQDVPPPRTAFERIKKLPPAHYLVLRDGRIELKKYWKLSYIPKHNMKIEELKYEIVERLREAVKIRLISDVPLGAFLSGGIDSSAVVALMSGIMNEPVKTFSIGFKEKVYNELKYARLIAKMYNTDHTEFIVEPDALDVLPKLVWHYNEPFADPSAIPTYYVSKLAREHVTVILNGDGGDENFAGYLRYALNEMSRQIRMLFPIPIARALIPLIMLLPQGKDINSLFWRLKRFFQVYIKPPEIRNLLMLCHFTTEMKKEMYTEDFLSNTSGIDSNDLMRDLYREANAESFIDKILYTDAMMYLPDALLVKVDVASMANSLEARSPFLDYKFMEFAACIPSNLKLKGRKTKYIFKEAFRDKLPDEVLFREKMGFGVPLDNWFRKELKEMMYDTLLGHKSMDRGYFNKAYIQKILNEHVTRKWNWQYHIYNLLMLELWHREFIDK